MSMGAGDKKNMIGWWEVEESIVHYALQKENRGEARWAEWAFPHKFIILLKEVINYIGLETSRWICIAFWTDTATDNAYKTM